MRVCIYSQLDLEISDRRLKRLIDSDYLRSLICALKIEATMLFFFKQVSNFNSKVGGGVTPITRHKHLLVNIQN